MKKLSFLQRLRWLLSGKPLPAAPAPRRPDYLLQYAELLAKHNQTLSELNETKTELIDTNQQYVQMVQDQARLEIENVNLKMILSGNYRTDSKPDPIQ